MSCALSVSKTGNEDFTGITGTSFTLDMTGAPGSGIVIKSMTYGGKSLTAAPFTFNIASGTKFLFIHFEALVPGAVLQVIENCGGSASQVLELIHFDPGNPGTGYLITSI